MNKFKINNMEELIKLNNVDWNSPNTQRNFILSTDEEVDYIIRKYRDNFAFGFDFRENVFTVMKYKDKGTIYIRKDNKHNFKNKSDRPPVSSVWDVKISNIEDIINYALNRNIH